MVVSGDVYEGDYLSDRRAGFGRFIWADGGKYEVGFYLFRYFFAKFFSSSLISAKLCGQSMDLKPFDICSHLFLIYRVTGRMT